jgi:hypothetical protein
MVREHLRMVIDTAERLEPLGCAAMLVDSRRSGDLRIRNVADEYVAEGVLGLSGQRRTPLPAHELLSIECMQQLFSAATIQAGDRLERSGPEHLPEHRRVLQQILLCRRKTVEPCRDDALHVLG